MNAGDAIGKERKQHKMQILLQSRNSMVEYHSYKVLVVGPNPTETIVSRYGDN